MALTSFTPLATVILPVLGSTFKISGLSVIQLPSLSFSTLTFSGSLPSGVTVTSTSSVFSGSGVISCVPSGFGFTGNSSLPGPGWGGVGVSGFFGSSFLLSLLLSGLFGFGVGFGVGSG